MLQKIQKIFFDFAVISFELVALDSHFYWERIVDIGWQYVNKQSLDFTYYENRPFRDDTLSEWSKNMTKTLPCRFKQSFEPFNMLTFHKCSDTGLLGHVINSNFCSL